MNRFVVKAKAKAKSKKKRIENAPHWTHSGTVAERRRALDELHTNRQFTNELVAHRFTDHLANMTSELGRLNNIRDLERPGLEFFRQRRDELRRLRPGVRANIDALQAHSRVPRAY